MSEKLSSIVGKQNDFATRFMGGGTIPAGETGPILTLTPPPGQRVRLTHLSLASPLQQVDVTLAFDGVTVTAGNINGAAPIAPTSYSVGSYQDYAAGTPPSGNYTYFTGEEDEVLTLVKGIGNTGNPIYYGYEFGE